MRNVRTILGLGVVAVFVSSGALLWAQQPEEATASKQGPPQFVLDAWETGQAPLVPEVGPPDWDVEMWQSGERPRIGDGFGPPAWILSLHAKAQEAGLPGPPEEVLEAWANGEGHLLPGPPDFVFDALGETIAD